MTEEIWKPVKGYEGEYEVSNLGRVKSLPRKTTSGKLLKYSDNGNGYQHLVLTKNGSQRDFYVHRLVAQTFIPNPDNLPEVNHKDENKANNCVDNLEWCNKKYNMNYGTAIKRASEKQMFHISQYTINGEYVASYYGLSEAANAINVGKSAITNCLKGRSQLCGGFIWKYKDKPCTPN